MVVDVVVCHWESLLVAEWKGGYISGDEGYRAQTARRTIRDQDNGRQWVEEGHHRMMVKTAFSDCSIHRTGVDSVGIRHADRAI